MSWTRLRVEIRPCSTCPFVKSTPLGVWDATEYERLAAFDDPQNLNHFMCHHSGLGKVPTVCRGWLALFPDSVGARILVIENAIEDDERFIVLPDDIELYESGTAARDAGLTAVEDPPVPARRAIDRLHATRDRQRRDRR